jgi:ring-1,2-phenylacetyl-CoA epoxidase subunit PaaC
MSGILVANLTVVLADNKYFLGRRLAEWAVGAPGLESAVACAAVAQEELGHARGLYSLLEALDEPSVPTPLERENDRDETYCVSYLTQSSSSWYDAVASLVLIDGALTTLLEAASSSSHDGLRKRAVRILADEPFHRKFADGRLKELARTGDAAALERRLLKRLPETLCWFGPADADALVTAGILGRPNEELRQDFVERLARVAAEAGLWLPLERQEHGPWNVGELPWSQWNSLQRRLQATPTTTPA